jgi:hypothetical protein
MFASLALLVWLGSLDCVEADARRVQSHLLRTEAALRAQPPAGLSPEQLAARLRSLDHLHAYAVRGVVPTNDRFAQPTPVFIDPVGTRCAMAALIEAEGGEDFVFRIARDRNNARVDELLNEPDLVSWLERNGMTAEEAGRIQPSYFRCNVPRPGAVCGGGDVAMQLWPTRVVDGGLFGTIERTYRGDGGRQPGDEIFLLPASEAAGLEPDFEAGMRLYAQFFWNGQLLRLAPIDTAGRIHHLADRRCAVRPSVDWAEATTLFDMDPAACARALGIADVSWFQPFCHWTNEYPDHCLTDGGVDPRLVTFEDGGLRPPQFDASIPDAGFDAGTVDAGHPQIGKIDEIPPAPPAGCGCAAMPLNAAAWIAALGLVRLRRRAAARLGK